MNAAVARTTVAVAVAAIATALLTGAGTGAQNGTATSGAATRDCSISETHHLVRTFISTFNRGNSAQLNRLFAPAESFKWYSTDAPGKRLGAAAYNRATLIRYFTARHAKHERLKLTSWHGGGNANGYSHFQFFLTRQARDLRPTRYEGKGAAICSDAGDTIAVWSMGRRRS